MEDPKEDIYAVNEYLADYVNEIEYLIGLLEMECGESPGYRWTQEQIRGCDCKLQSVEYRYLQIGGRSYNPGGTLEENRKAAIAQHPKKVARIDACVKIINDCENLSSFKQAVNEIMRLAHGRNSKLVFKGKRADPNKLVL